MDSVDEEKETLGQYSCYTGLSKKTLAVDVGRVSPSLQIVTLK
jgi:hypothetical protein